MSLAPGQISVRCRGRRSSRLTARAWGYTDALAAAAVAVAVPLNGNAGQHSELEDALGTAAVPEARVPALEATHRPITSDAEIPVLPDVGAAI